MSTTPTEARHGRINGSPVRCTYRVCRDLPDQVVRLFVTRDGKIWIGYGDGSQNLSHVANVGENGTSRAAVCAAANYW